MTCMCESDSKSTSSVAKTGSALYVLFSITGVLNAVGVAVASIDPAEGLSVARTRSLLAVLCSAAGVVDAITSGDRILGCGFTM